MHLRSTNPNCDTELTSFLSTCFRAVRKRSLIFGCPNCTHGTAESKDWVGDDNFSLCDVKPGERITCQYQKACAEGAKNVGKLKFSQIWEKFSPG
jgi:hypothetical protein